MAPFATSTQHILAELERIDLLVRAWVWHARQVAQVDESFQGLYLTEEEIERYRIWEDTWNDTMTHT